MYGAPVQALLDTGCDSFVTNNLFVIHNFRLLQPHEWIKSKTADGTSHISKYGGDVRFVDRADHWFLIHFQPTLNITAVGHAHLCSSSKTVLKRTLLDVSSDDSSIFVVDYSDGSQDTFELDTFRSPQDKILRHFTKPLVPIDKILLPLYHSASSLDDIASLWSPSSRNICIQTRLNSEVTRILWHHRLGHASDNLLVHMHNLADNVPVIRPKTSLEKCDSCLAIVPKRSKFSADRAIPFCDDPSVSVFQHLQADVGIMVQKSGNDVRYRRLTSFSGNRVYFTLEDMKTNYVFGICLPSKSTPLEWLHFTLTKITPWKSSTRSIRMDEGKETSKNAALNALLHHFGYFVDETGPDNSSAIGKVEAFNRIIKNAVVRLLYSVNLSPKYWDLAFYHLLRLYNNTPRGPNKVIPYTAVTGKKPDLKFLRIFGCPVSVRNYRATASAEPNTVRGIFVGYNNTTKLPMFIPFGKSTVHDAPHCVFDETFSSYPDDKLPPVAIALRRALGLSIPISVQARHPIKSVPDLDILFNHDDFPSVIKLSFDPTRTSFVGLVLQHDVVSGRGYVTDVLPKSLAASIKNWNSVLIGAFVIQVSDDIVFTVKDIEDALSRAVERSAPFDVWFSSDIDDPVPPIEASTVTAKLSKDQLRNIHSIISTMNVVTGEDAPVKFLPQDVVDLPASTGEDMCTTSSIGEDLRICTVSTSKTTSFTRKHLKLRDDWPEWQASEFKQLDAMERDNMFGRIVLRRDLLPDHADILRTIWTYKEKLMTGEKKSRVCGDGRHLRVSKFDMQTFQASSNHQSTRMVIALAAHENLIIYDLDAVNAFAQSGKFARPTFLLVDAVLSDWYLARHGRKVPPGAYVELLSSIQGHPDAGANWQKKVNKALSDEAWTSSFHDPCLYHRHIQGADQYLVRQVDDMLAAVSSHDAYRALAKELEIKINLVTSNEPTKYFNGMQIEQTRHYIAVRVEEYILQIMKKHGWENLQFRKKPMAPLPESLAKKILEEGHGPKVGTPEHKLLEREMGFAYRTVLGEIIFAYVISRLDIGYAISILSRAAEYPRDIDYQGLKSVCRFLRAHADRPLVYWRKKPLEELPEGTLRPMPVEDGYRYIYPSDPYRIFADVDASHATDLTTRRSTGGHVKFWFGSPIDWSSKLQRTLALNSTEAEFMQAVICSKSIIHARHIAKFMRREQKGPSLLCEDNRAAISIVNQGRPTERARHIDVQWFAIQEWKRTGIVRLHHVASTVNSADALTKALGSVLSTRHAYRAMGLYGSPYSYGPYKLEEVDLVDDESEQLSTDLIGEDVEGSTSDTK